MSIPSDPPEQPLRGVPSEDEPVSTAFALLRHGQLRSFVADVRSGLDIRGLSHSGDSVATEWGRVGMRGRPVLEVIAEVGGIDIPDSENITALGHAVLCADMEMIRTLLSLGASVAVPLSGEPTMIHAAVSSLDRRVCSYLLHYADRRILEMFNGAGHTPLMEAIATRDEAMCMDVIAACMALGADLDISETPGGEAASHHAARWGNPVVVRQLLQAGADFDRAVAGETARQLAMRLHDPRLDMVYVLRNSTS